MLKHRRTIPDLCVKTHETEKKKRKIDRDKSTLIFIIEYQNKIKTVPFRLQMCFEIADR